MSKSSELIINYCHIRSRIDNYNSVIHLCLTAFNFDNILYLKSEARAYLQKITEGSMEFFSLLNKLDIIYFEEKKVTADELGIIRHDLRLAINIIQGYSEILLEECAQQDASYMGGHFTLIISATREMLKNIELLKIA